MACRYSASEAEDPSQRELALAELSGSDEDPGDLLSGGADVDDLIAAGILDGGENERQGWQDVEGVELPEQPVNPVPMTPEEFQAVMARYDWFINREYLNAPSQPL